MTKKESIYLYIRDNVSLENIKESIKKYDTVGVDAFEIQDKLNIVRNNASTLLNELWRSGKLIKIVSRPVRFIPSEIINENVFKDICQNWKTEFTLNELKELIREWELMKESKKEDPFKSLIGSNNSLLNPIGQAKAAIMYPPNGLHTLILGKSGVGKTTFANTMYEFARRSKGLSNKELPFISFNCSDYFNNPQLLLSQLFGSVKGAFTGADSDKRGLVEEANGGILFLDEVHRLPPDGQEMLFFLIDKGEYHRLGETGKTRKSNVLIIAATTEDPNDVLLTTFLRRIPVIIKLPCFEEKDIGERVEIIENLFYNEAVKLKIPISISPEVLKALSIYEFAGNIGELSSEIKLLCAKAFLQHIQNNQNIQKLKVEFQMLKKEIRENIFKENKIQGNVKEFLDIFNEEIIISPSNTDKNYSKSLNENIYDDLLAKVEELKNKGLDEKQIDIQINEVIENYFKKVINKLNFDSLNIRQLYKIIDKKIVDSSIELINYASQKLNTKFSSKLVFGFAFHIQSLIKRLKQEKPIKNPNLIKIKKIYPEEYEVAQALIVQLNSKFNVEIPEDEKGFLAILLANNKDEKESESKIGIFVICHGESTASSMANVANSLLNFNFVKAIDMPLDSEIAEIYNKVLATVVALDKGKGVLLLVDMGSLVDFGDRIMNETGIKVRTIDNVSTLLVLESLRRVMYKKEGLNTIYKSLIKKEVSNSNVVVSKKRAIITVCVTGQGASMMAKNILFNILSDSFNNSDIEIIPLDYVTAENDSEEFQKLNEEYDIIACVGSLKPKIDIPYFPINQLLNDKFKDKFIKFLEISVSKNRNYDEDETKKSVYDISREMLEQYVKCINPRFAVAYIKKFIDELNLSYNNDESSLIDLIVHLGCMLDRCIHKDIVKFDNVNQFIANNKIQFLKIRKAAEILEKAYRIKIVDDEICYIIKVLKK
ncbi:sigma 54-interacting transcriptional regulator [Haloimpatiens sp. FM7330]|uniref:sigma 54-interacting transcriptional regulator n=1 Tax=Haloimpatiens sp. FM7330 TaxID=3298610 RepID=UPI00363E1EA5